MMKMVKQKGISLDLKTPMNSLKDSLSLAGKTSQSLNRLRRQLIKPSLPSKFAKLADNDDDSAKFLFGDNISESLESLSKEHKIKYLLKDKTKITMRQLQIRESIQSCQTGSPLQSSQRQK